MYEKLFAQAVLPAPVQVFGRELKTYSLGHELWFERQDLLPVTALNVSTAAFLCLQNASEISGMNHDFLIRLKLKIWNRHIRKFNLFNEFKKFEAYRTAGSLELPCQSPAQSFDATPSRFLGSPFLIRLEQFLVLHFRLTESQAWDYPFGLAKMHYATWMEDARRMEVKNESDLKVDIERAKWMAEHPDDGIEILEKEAENA